MKVIDSHQHFWKYDPVRDAWINDDMKILQRDFLPADLHQEYLTNGVDGCIAVQADQSEAETRFLLDLAADNDFILGVVGWVDLQSVDIDEKLESWSKEKKLKGFRHIVQGEPDPEFMLGEAFLNGLSKLAQYNFTYDILVFPHQLKAALEVVKKFPEQKFVIDHIAKPYIAKGEIDDWAALMKEIGTHQNVWCKVSGIITEADWKNWTFEQLKPYMDVVVEAFGTARLMFGSDWPVCLLAADYSAVKEIPSTFFQNYSEEDRKKVFGENAQEFYRIDS